MILMNKNVKIFLIVLGSSLLLFIVLCIFASILWDAMIYEHEQRFKPSGKVYKNYEKLDNEHLYVVTKDDYNDEINYYKVDQKLILSESDKFEYEENDVLHLSVCFKSYIDHNKNEVLNKLDKNNCKVMDNDWNVTSSNEDLDNIIKLVSNLEHDIILSDVVKLNEDYYVIIGLNVNFWSPYYLYKYEDNKLKRIYCFDGEKIISLNQIQYCSN